MTEIDEPFSGENHQNLSKIKYIYHNGHKEKKQHPKYLKYQQKLQQHKEQHSNSNLNSYFCKNYSTIYTAKGKESNKNQLADITSNCSTTTSPTTSSSISQNITNNNFAWHKLLAPPPKQMVVIERMHSGARRYVILDFGWPIILTDVFIPSCDDLDSLTIDTWLNNEETDSVRLVVASDIGMKTLVLSDLQPPPVCRYMKISLMGRFGKSTSKCKIPIGSFFGHVITMGMDQLLGSNQLANQLKCPSYNSEADIKTLVSLYEDVHCRYSLASCKLLELLDPLLNADITNVAHMQSFINKQRDDDTSYLQDNAKIMSIYEVGNIYLRNIYCNIITEVCILILFL